MYIYRQDCEWWSWTSNTGICEALRDCPIVDKTKNGTVSGERGCSAYSCDIQGQCEGTLVDGIISATKVLTNSLYHAKQVKKEGKIIVWHKSLYFIYLFYLLYVSLNNILFIIHIEFVHPELSTRSSMSLVHLL